MVASPRVVYEGLEPAEVKRLIQPVGLAPTRRLDGQAMPSDGQARVAAGAGSAPAIAAATGANLQDILLLGEALPNRLEAAFSDPFGMTVEAGGTGADPLSRYRHWTAGRQSAFWLTSRTVLDGDAVYFAARGLSRLLDLTSQTANDLATALHEAAVNAALHGNLCIETGPRTSMEGLAAYYREVERRKEEGDLASLYVGLLAAWDDRMLWVDVLDCGEGFSPADLDSSDPRVLSRGLNLVRTIAQDVDISPSRGFVRMNFSR